MTPPVCFRRATPADIPALLALVHEAYRGDASRAGWTTEADLLDGQRTDEEELARLIGGGQPATRIVVGSVADELVASLLVESRPDCVYLGLIAVKPARQARGLGAMLLGEAERIVREEGLAPRLRMTVIAQRTELIAWYRRRGFLPTGERAGFPYGQPRFGLPRRPDLYFVILEKEL